MQAAGAAVASVLSPVPARRLVKAEPAGRQARGEHEREDLHRGSSVGHIGDVVLALNLSRRARTLVVMVRGCLFYVLAMMVGCVEAQLIECADGRACPLGTACDDVHASCVEPAQLAVCVGVSQETPCAAGAALPCPAPPWWSCPA